MNRAEDRRKGTLVTLLFILIAVVASKGPIDNEEDIPLIWTRGSGVRLVEPLDDNSLPPSRANVPLGQPWRLPCEAVDEDTETPLTSVWRTASDAVHISQPRRRTYIEIWSVGEGDEGFYECVVDTVDHGRVIVARVALIVQHAPRVNIGEKEVIVARGHLLRVTCDVFQARPSPNVIWTRNGTPPLQPSDRVAIALLPTSTTVWQSILHIRHAAEGDQGLYECHASNAGGNATSKAIQVNIVDMDVQSSPIVSPKNTTARTHSGVSFECDLGRRATWRRIDGERLPVDRTHLTVDGSMLTIDHVQAYDEGEYECKAVNGTLARRAILTVESPPVWRTTPSDAVIGNDMTTTRFRCHVDGTPQPKVQWYKNAKLILRSSGRVKMLPVTIEVNKVDGRKYKFDLVISSGRAEDEGIYQCVVSNRHGQVSAVARFVYDKISTNETDLHRPRNLRVVRVNGETRKITLAWDVLPESLLLINKPTTYIVHFYGLGAAKDATENNQPFRCNSTTCQLECCQAEMQAFTDYKFWVTAIVRRSSMTARSNDMVARTWDGRSRASLPLTVAQIGQQRMTIGWHVSRGDVDNVPGTIVKFIVQQRRMTGDTSLLQEYEIGNVDRRSMPTDVLRAGVRYALRVLAVTNAGRPTNEEMQREEFVWTIVRVAEEGNEGDMRIEELTVEQVNENSVQVSWQWSKAANAKEVHLAARNMLTGHVTNISLPSTATKHTFIHLDSATQYTMSVWSVNHVDEPSRRSRASVRTRAQPPVTTTKPPRIIAPLIESPDAIECHSGESGVLSISWHVPPSIRHLVRYHMRYVPMPPKHISLKKWELKNTESETTSIRLPDLIPGRTYLIALKSEDDKGFSSREFGPWFNCTTDGELPKPVTLEHVSAVSLNATAMTISWSPLAPSSDADVVRHYNVYVSQSNRRAKPKRISPSEHTVVIARRPGTYFVWVTASTDSTEGDMSSVQIVVLDENESPSSSSPSAITWKSALLYTIAFLCLCACVCAFVMGKYLTHANRQMRRSMLTDGRLYDEAVPGGGVGPCCKWCCLTCWRCGDKPWRTHRGRRGEHGGAISSSVTDPSSISSHKVGLLGEGKVYKDTVDSGDVIDMQIIEPEVTDSLSSNRCNVTCDSKGGVFGARPRSTRKQQRISTTAIVHRASEEERPILSSDRHSIHHNLPHLGIDHTSSTPMVVAKAAHQVNDSSDISSHSIASEHHSMHDHAVSMPNLTDSGVDMPHHRGGGGGVKQPHPNECCCRQPPFMERRGHM